MALPFLRIIMPCINAKAVWCRQERLTGWCFACCLIFRFAGCIGERGEDASSTASSHAFTMSNVLHLQNRRYASLACNGCRESKIKVLCSASILEQGSAGANDHSAMDKHQAVQIVTRRTGNAFIELLTRGSTYTFVGSMQC